MGARNGYRMVEISQRSTVLARRSGEQTWSSRSSKNFGASRESPIERRAKRHAFLSVYLRESSFFLRVESLACLLTRGVRGKVRHLTVAALLIIPLPALAQHPVATPAWNLTTLMSMMHQVRESSARFVETKHLHLLNQAQTSSGRLIYVAPDRLRKETLEPAAASMTIAGDRLTIERLGEKPREISLRDYSEVGALVESIRATLAGDLPALTAHFAAVLDGDAKSWSLTLTPLEPKLRELVTAIRIRGERTAIHEIETTEADGDRTDMAITPDPK
jgi:hypothetical protein